MLIAEGSEHVVHGRVHVRASCAYLSLEYEAIVRSSPPSSSSSSYGLKRCYRRWNGFECRTYSQGVVDYEREHPSFGPARHHWKVLPGRPRESWYKSFGSIGDKTLHDQQRVRLDQSDRLHQAFELEYMDGSSLAARQFGYRARGDRPRCQGRPC